MKKHFKVYLSAFLATLMLCGAFLSSCGGNAGGEADSSREENEGSLSETEKESVTSNGSESETEDESPEYEEILNFDGSKTVEYANHIKDGANAYYLDSVRSAAVVENMNMKLVHGLNGNLVNKNVKNLVNSISNKDGGVYIRDTMDAFIKTSDGRTYYASEWMTGSSFNIYRGGFYYYDARITDQGFGDVQKMLGSAVDVDVSIFKPTEGSGDSKYSANGDGSYSFMISGVTDPGIESSESLRDLDINSKTYNALLITMKTEKAYNAQIFIKVQGSTNYSAKMSKYISLIPGDDYHTYVVRLDDIDSVKGFITGIRIDLNGYYLDSGCYDSEKIDIMSVKAVDLEGNRVPVRFDRGLHVYSDKLHQELHFVTTADVKNLASYGLKTEISADTVAKILVKDKNGEKNTIEGIDWESAEYVAFDIKDVGIFGYILANDKSSGKLTVIFDGESYVITQEYTLDGNIVADKTDFYMGSRIYTDQRHSFDSFKKEAYAERNPLTDENISVIYDRYNKAQYLGYDFLRGAYEVSMGGTSFSNAYYLLQNRHYKATVTVKGDSVDRKIYLYTSTTGGGLECAAVLDKNDMLLPIPLEVIKNFAGDGEASIYIDDTAYSETYLPIKIDKGEEQSFSILNMYQNWGKYPLKQLSWIQYYAPYYHLSTGVTETNCIAMLYGGSSPGFQRVNNASQGIIYEYHVISGKNYETLPDFRAMSAKLWDDQPQHNSTAGISWLEYTDASGKSYASDFVNDRIDSAGPTYADISMDYISDDGRINASFRHAEMPQTDENRTYYSLKYDINDTIEFKDFKENFTIIEINGKYTPYENIGYLNENNKCVIEAANKSRESRYITLGDKSPYFAMFGVLNNESGRATNYALIIKDWDILIGGKKYDGRFILEEWFMSCLNFTRLTLDLGDVTLQKGDYIHMDMILLPWGKPDAKDDSNVRGVREDSCLAPFKAEVAVGSVIKDSFIPKVMAENNSAEFTFSGGHNNGVVRVYGFDKLTSPTIYEKIGGEWVKYDPSSVTLPDSRGNAHYYDGYCVHYDGDGLYSYSFIIDTDHGKARTFKIVAEDFVPYPDEPNQPGEDPLPGEDNAMSDSLVDGNETDPTGEYAPELYFSAQEIYLLAKDTNIPRENLDVYKLRREDDGIKYATLLSYGEEVPEAYITPIMGEKTKTAPYIAIKYRSTTENIYIDFWLNSTAASFKNRVSSPLKSDGEWQFLVLDAKTMSNGSFDGSKTLLFRIDFVNAMSPALPKDSYIDIAYIGFFDSEEQAYKFEMGDEYKTLDEIRAEKNAACISPDSGYTDTKVVYGANLDFINAKAVADQGGNSKNGVSIFDGLTTFSTGKIVFTGWAVADGGIKDYVYSLDGGKTWNVIACNPGDGAGQAHYNVICSRIGKHTFSSGSNIKSTFQGAAAHGENIAGISIDLSEYGGQTVELIFAAIPKAQPDSLCLFAKLTNLKVAE